MSSNINNVHFGTNRFGGVIAKVHIMFSLLLFFCCVFFNFESALLPLLSSSLCCQLATRRQPRGTLTFAVARRPSKPRCSVRSLLDCVQLTALRPRGFQGQWPYTKAPGALATSATRFPKPGEEAGANPTHSPHTRACTRR